MTRPATANATALYYCIQDVEGELPTSPVFKKLPFTGGVPAIARDTLTSSVLDGTPEVTGIRLGSLQVTNDAGIELKYSVHNDFLAAALQSSWVAGASTTSASATIDASAQTITVEATDMTGSIEVGDMIALPSMTETYNKGPHLVTAISFATNTVITVGSIAANELLGREGLTDETASTVINVNSTLSVGTTPAYIALLTVYNDLESGTAYDLTMDAEVTGFNLSVSVNAMVTGSFSLIGKSYSGNTSLPSGATLTDVTNYPSFTGIDGCLFREGEKVRLSTSAEITFDRNATPVYELCSKYISHISYEKVTNTVALSTYFTDYDIETQFLNEEVAEYAIMLTLDGKALAFTYPSALITEAPKDVSTGDITISASLQGYKADGVSSSLIIRDVSI